MQAWNRTQSHESNQQVVVRICFLGLLLCFASVTVPKAYALSGEIREFQVGAGPVDLTPGPDGNIWFTEIGADRIGRITRDGVFTDFPVPTPNSFPHGISAGPDRAIWFTEINVGKIGRITLDGEVTEFALSNANSQPHDITLGPDGNLWFVEINADQIGRITPEGKITEFPLPTAGQQGGPSSCGPATAVSQPYVITTGPDRNLWFTECSSNKIGRITLDGKITEFVVQTPNSQPHGITMGPDGNLWFAEYSANNIGVMDRDGTMFTEVPIPTAKSGAHDLTVGPDGKIWFCEITANQIGRISSGSEHSITEFAVPNLSNGAFGNLFAIASDRPALPGFGRPQSEDGENNDGGGNIWFVALSDNRIGQLR